MDFESPDVAKEFPGLYLGEGGKGKAMSTPGDFDEESDKKKKKEKKDSKKDKGYAALAGESSHDEDETLDSKSPGKVKKLKTFKLSTKKKDKKLSGDKDKDKKSCEKEVKKSEKDKKSQEKEKDKKIAEKDKEVHKSAEKETIRPRRPFSGENLHANKDISKISPASQGVVSASGINSSGSSQSHVGGPFEGKDVPSSSGAVVSTLKEKTSALNAFLNAPAPIFTKKKHKDSKEVKVEKEHKDKKDKDKEKDKKDKEHKESKKDKDHGVSKVKLKLKRSKNSLEDSQTGDFPITTSHQFPEDPDSIAKEIRKYETLLEQTHTHIKGSKKVSKKQEEQLWELQRTLTQLKRKLRSVNALSSASSASIFIQNPISTAHPVPSKASVEREIVLPPVSTVAVTTAKVHNDKPVNSDATKTLKPEEDVTDSVITSDIKEDDITLDFTLKTLSSKTSAKVFTEKSVVPALSPPPKIEKAIESVEGSIIPTPKTSTTVVQTSRNLAVRRSLDLSDLPNNNVINIVPIPELENGEGESIKQECESPKQELERVKVYVQVHHKGKSITPEHIKQPLDPEDIDDTLVVDETEIMENAVDDANKMIGSIHEELEAAAIVFGASEDFVSSTPNPKAAVSLASRNQIPQVSNYRRNSQGEEYKSTTVPIVFALGPYEDESKITISKSEPTFGDGKENRSRHEILDTSMEDYENDSDFEFVDESDLTDPFTMPIFETEEYLSLENEALVIFNEQIQEEIKKEEAEIQILMQQLASMEKRGVDVAAEEELQDFDEYHMDELIALWQFTKMENEALNENVNGLKLLVATNRLEQFQLETRLKYLEERVTAISPLTMTTPLQTDV